MWCDVMWAIVMHPGQQQHYQQTRQRQCFDVVWCGVVRARCRPNAVLLLPKHQKYRVTDAEEVHFCSCSRVCAATNTAATSSWPSDVLNSGTRHPYFSLEGAEFSVYGANRWQILAHVTPGRRCRRSRTARWRARMRGRGEGARGSMNTTWKMTR